jgi:hypothetical protein
MRSMFSIAAVGAAFTIAACSEPEPTAVLPVFSDGPAMSLIANGHHAAVPLSGRDEVPARDTRARGTAIFHLSADGLELQYKLIVANIENVVAAHIHRGPPDDNGPVVVFLYGNVPAGGGRINGVIAEGTLTAEDFVSAFSGWTMDDLVAEMKAGNTYVNVHTNDGVPPTDTGPGDFPGGEIRGQIR